MNLTSLYVKLPARLHNIYWSSTNTYMRSITFVWISGNPDKISMKFQLVSSWWRHQMETFSALLAICAGNSPVSGEFPAKGQWRGALMFTLICARMNVWVNTHDAGDYRRHHAHYDVIVMCLVERVKIPRAIENLADFMTWNNSRHYWPLYR